MFRDHFKDERYFQESTNRLKATLDVKKKELLAKPQPYYMEYYAMADGLGIYISLAYSRGVLVKDLVAPCREMLDFYTLCIKPDDDYSDGGGLIYSQLLSMVAMGVLLDTRDALERLGNKLAGVGYHDYLMSFLVRYAIPGYKQTEELLWPEDAGCLKLKEITQSNKADAADGMYEYLQKFYYTRNNLEDEYNSHKKSDNTYIGYWSFESAAIAKVMQLDDSKLKTSPYYPYDMLHGDPPGATGPADLPPAPGAKGPDEEKTAKKKWWQF
ncbi:PoNe immunity protein domain-containing protein [Chitinophaga sp. GCM10012297]|uniref:DUF1911 domain-containing protein n=1 Tax=Chitinophaga chungangae TaxID=2821488 RepID=A0ABS3YGL9_9BACT|nr:PoNe immunity protein domain-containing protein [Chitinophaga chungangae]MBO9153825.1 DUF1911 domain-containing protein [Chitinophaga chungangae]